MSMAIYTGDPLLYDEGLEEDIDFFDKNMSKKYYTPHTLPSFLDFHSSFLKSGKQGVLGLLINPKTRKKYVYKISQYVNHLISHEHKILEQLNTIREFCPHFCKTLGKFETNLIESYKKLDNPFELEDCEDDRKKTMSVEVLLMENIDGGRKFYRYIKNSVFTPEISMSIIKQTLIATLIASEQTKFTHYDLHSNNVLVKKCPINSVFFYILDDNRTYLVPTYGYYPIIIDFGFSFIQNCEDGPIYGPLSFTDIGHITTNYDKNADAKLFLTSVSYEMKKYKKSDVSTRFRQLVKNIYKDCHVDLECGWDNREDEISISDQLKKKLNNKFKRSEFFKNQGHLVVDMLQTLIILPLRNRETRDNMDDLMSEIITEFMKIEKLIKSDYHRLYIFKNIVDCARIYRKDYLNKSSRSDAISYFKEDVLFHIDKICRFCNPKISWEKLLCSLLCISKCVENFCFDRLKKLLSQKKSDYNRMLIKNTSEIFEAIEANIPSHFFFDEKTIIYVWDIVNRRNYKMKVDLETVKLLNKTHPFERGIVLYEKIVDKNY